MRDEMGTATRAALEEVGLHTPPRQKRPPWKVPAHERPARWWELRDRRVEWTTVRMLVCIACAVVSVASAVVVSVVSWKNTDHAEATARSEDAADVAEVAAVWPSMPGPGLVHVEVVKHGVAGERLQDAHVQGSVVGGRYVATYCHDVDVEVSP